MAVQDSAFTVPLSQIKHAELFDLHCRVLEVVNIKGKMVLFVWDGSDARPFPPMMNTGFSGTVQSCPIPSTRRHTHPHAHTSLLDFN